MLGAVACACVCSVHCIRAVTCVSISAEVSGKRAFCAVSQLTSFPVITFPLCESERVNEVPISYRPYICHESVRVRVRRVCVCVCVCVWCV